MYLLVVVTMTVLPLYVIQAYTLKYYILTDGDGYIILQSTDGGRCADNK